MSNEGVHDTRDYSRRHWSDTDKIRIVEESFLGHRQVAATARRHGVSRSLLTIWRRQYRDGELGDETPPSFIPLAVSPMAPAVVPATAQEEPRDTPDVQLEIVLRNGRRLLAPSSVEPEVLARLLPALEGR
ncbi:IS66-like element accessory protein TnpA [Pseudodonghicola flavimaris]|uniref:Transposase n=1 Tax=Pseudodonghicola flavimaris TaxID=3050036 RepID=A0ABT7F860_9RHOB|nr:transposase [Pseudodonghicola flavimaris]MDK3020809.1 transposase [Pseudodonghicola flavimaris]